MQDLEWLLKKENLTTEEMAYLIAKIKIDIWPRFLAGKKRIGLRGLCGLFNDSELTVGI